MMRVQSGACGLTAPPTNSMGQGAKRTKVTGSTKLKWLPTTINGPPAGTFSSPRSSRRVRRAKAGMESCFRIKRIGRRRNGWMVDVMAGML